MMLPYLQSLDNSNVDSAFQEGNNKQKKMHVMNVY